MKCLLTLIVLAISASFAYAETNKVTNVTNVITNTPTTNNFLSLRFDDSVLKQYPNMTRANDTPMTRDKGMINSYK